MDRDCACCEDTDCTCAADSCVCNDYSAEEKMAYFKDILDAGFFFTREMMEGKTPALPAAILNQAFKKALNAFDDTLAALRPDLIDRLWDVKQAAQDLVFYLTPSTSGETGDSALIEQVLELKDAIAAVDESSDSELFDSPEI